MWTVKYFTTPLLIFSLSLMLISCDSSTSADSDDISNIPERPSFSKMEMKTGTFDESTLKITKLQESEEELFQTSFKNTSNNTLMKFNEFPAYTVASGLVSTFESLHQININMLNDFMHNWDKEEANLTENGYVWDYTTTNVKTGETFSLEVTATETDNNVDWSVIAALDSEELAFEEQQIMEGTTAKDGSTGQWYFNLEIPENDFFVESTISWVMDDETLSEMELEVSFLEDGDLVNAEGKYELLEDTGHIYEAKIETPQLEEASQSFPYDINFTEFFEVEWDINSGEGFIEIDSEKFCWDENQIPTAC